MFISSFDIEYKKYKRIKVKHIIVNIINLIDLHLFSLGNKGRMLNLLKEKSKVGIANKSRKKHVALSPLKRLKKEEPMEGFVLENESESS